MSGSGVTPDTRVVSVRFPVDEVKRLRAAADREGCSVSRIVRQRMEVARHLAAWRPVPAAVTTGANPLLSINLKWEAS